MFTINGIVWNLRLVEPHSTMLMRSDNTYTFGMTDRNTQCIYISNRINGSFFFVYQYFFLTALLQQNLLFEPCPLYF